MRLVNSRVLFAFAALVVASAAHARLFNGRVNFGPNPRTGNFDIEIIDPDGIGDYRVLQGGGPAGPVEVPWTPAGDCPGRVRFALPAPGQPHLQHKHRLDYHDCQSPPQLETWVLQGGVPFAAGELQEATRVVVSVPLEEETGYSPGFWLALLAILLAVTITTNIAVLVRVRRLTDHLRDRPSSASSRKE